MVKGMAPKGSPKAKATSALPEAELSCYSIHVASRLTTIEPATLRKWEARYGFPSPERREGGSRVYSEGDISRLRLISRALERGHRAGEIVPRTSQELERILAVDEDSSSASENAGAPLPTVDDLIEALRRDDVLTITRAFARARRVLGPRRFVTDVAHPLSVRVGEAWAQGLLDIRHEHVMTGLLSREIAVQLATSDAPPGQPLVVLGTPPNEHHAISLELIAVYLTSLGVAPLILGAETPADELARAAVAHRASAVAFSMMGSFPAKAARGYLARLAELLPARIPIWVGGSGSKHVASVPRCVRIATWSELTRAASSLQA